LTGHLFSTTLSSKMPRIVDEAEQRRRIRQAARRAFARLGLEGTGLKHVALEAGLGRSSLYHYYPDKAALVQDLADELLDEETALFTQAIQSGDGALDRIERLTTAIVELFDRSASTGRLMLQIWANDPDRFQAMLDMLRGGLTQVVMQGQEHGEIDPALHPEAAATLVIALMDGVLVQGFIDPRLFEHKGRLGDALLTAVRRMLATPRTKGD
jgi:AcrR family transcriptional regulator